jgi:hypothetical protein
MARKVILETAYTFSPSSKTLVIPKAIPRERLLLITNVTQNQVIYNFSDPSLNATSYQSIEANGVETTTVVFNYNTASMLTTDKIQVTIDDYEETIIPTETMMDPTNKIRVTQPQALIDTDFEYGTQVSKWENLALYNNKPFAYTSPTPIANIGSITFPTSSYVVTVALTSGVGPANGTPITVQDTYLSAANGNFVVETGGGTSSFTYSASSKNSSANITNILDPSKTSIFTATPFSGARIGFIPTVSYSSNRIDVTTTVDHGLALGNEIVIKGMTSTTNTPNGNYVVAQILSPTRFAYFADLVPTGTLTGPIEVYVRPQGSFLHRPADGGVIFGTNSGSNYAEAYRQTRRYFRYQSGKGIQMSSGTILKPYAGIDSITSSGTTVTVATKEKHCIQPGTIVKIGGCDQSAYNGTFVVNSILGYNKFAYTALTTPTSTLATGNPFASIEAWYGAQNRLGMFDNQNGVFFEYDGTQLYVVRRNSTTQLSGRVNVTNGSDTVTQSAAEFPTYFNKQLIPGDSIVIRGQSYKVSNILSDTTFKISPAYRGATASLCIYSKTVDTKIPQSQFNMDKADGTGPSQYTMDLSKMQMFYVDYTWYGAGFIRWGVRGPKGNIIYLHKLQNNNVNTEAYMRSGNLPGRYSATTNPPFTSATDNILTTSTSIPVLSTTGFPTSGTLCIKNASQYEYVNYSGKTATTFTGLTRAKTGYTGVAVTMGAGNNTGTIADGTASAAIQVGMRAISSELPDEAFVAAINPATGAITLSQPTITANPTVSFPAMGASNALQFTYDVFSPTGIELAFPSFAPTISHWGTSVIMDGRYDEDKSLIFTYGQKSSTALAPAGGVTTSITGSSGNNTITVGANTNLVTGMLVTGTGVGSGAIITNINGTTITVSVNNSGTVSGTGTFSGATTKALLAIRVAPSADNGVSSVFGAREVVNRMQLNLAALNVLSTASIGTPTVLITATLNGVSSSAVNWTNAVGNLSGVVNSSLAQIADFAGLNVTVNGGEVTGGFFSQGTDSVDLKSLRDLGNSILGGGGTTTTAGIYPDGPDVLTISVTNLGSTNVNVYSRLSWTEASA